MGLTNFMSGVSRKAVRVTESWPDALYYSREPSEFSGFLDKFMYVAMMGPFIDACNWWLAASKRFAEQAPKADGFDKYMGACNRSNGTSDHEGCYSKYSEEEIRYINDCFATNGRSDPSGCREYDRYVNYVEDEAVALKEAAEYEARGLPHPLMWNN
jgi:hypothetical protein